MNNSTHKMHQWSSGRMVRCHGTNPGSIVGWCMWIWAVMIHVCSIDGLILRHQSQINDVEHDSQLVFSSSFLAIKKSH